MDGDGRVKVTARNKLALGTKLYDVLLLAGNSQEARITIVTPEEVETKITGVSSAVCKLSVHIQFQYERYWIEASSSRISDVFTFDNFKALSKIYSSLGLVEKFR